VISPACIAHGEEEERRRLRRVVELMLDGWKTDVGLSDFVARVAAFFDVPTCVVTAVTKTEQIWTAAYGLAPDLDEIRRAPRSESFCTHAVSARSALIVQDAADNPFFCDNPWVRERGLRFYAGVPLVHYTGETVGTLCLMDVRPRVFTHHDLSLLTVLGRRVLAEIEWREHQKTPTLGGTRYLNYVDRDLGIMGRDALVDILSVEACRAMEQGKRVSVVCVRVPVSQMRTSAEKLGHAFAVGWVGRLSEDTLGVLVTGVCPAEATDRVRAALGDVAVSAGEARLYAADPLETLCAIEQKLAES
jgi:hypothetical protein